MRQVLKRKLAILTMAAALLLQLFVPNRVTVYAAELPMPFDDMTAVSYQGDGGASVLEFADGEYVLDCDPIGAQPWSNQIRMEIAVEAGNQYLYDVLITADSHREVTMEIEGQTEKIDLPADEEVSYQKLINANSGVLHINLWAGRDDYDGAVGAKSRVKFRPVISTDGGDENGEDGNGGESGEEPGEGGEEPGEGTADDEPIEFSDIELKVSGAENGAKLSFSQVDEADSYVICRSTGRYAEGEEIAALDADAAEYIDETEDSPYNYTYKVYARKNGEIIGESDADSLEMELLGENVYVFSPSDPVDEINDVTGSLAEKMLPASSAEFTDDRYALLFKPGRYDINTIQVGFYTQVAGLGLTPYETVIPRINVDSSTNGNALINFWRSVENISIDTGNPGTEVKYAASQAAPMRRLYVNGKLHFDDIGREASGGFLADSVVTGQTGSWSQQQYFLRNNILTGGWYNGVWNIFFEGNENAPATSEDWGNTGYDAHASVDTTDVIREKPFLFVDESGEYKVFVPGLRRDTAGVSYTESNPGVGEVRSLDSFYVARQNRDDADAVNAALSEGKDILFTPGVYEFDRPINVTRPGTVVLGLGMATIRVKNTDTGMRVADEDGIVIAGLLFEAGSQGSDSLLEVGSKGSSVSHADNPILLSDIFTRVGGGNECGKTVSTVIINSADVIGDHFWLWRADHGKDVGWYSNTAANGLVVNGDRVTIHGLFVEHFQEYQVLWNGDGGCTYFYQSEIPYDVPHQDDWMSGDGTVRGFASYKVSDSAEGHKAMGLGIYSVFIHTEEEIILDNAIEVSPGTEVYYACTNALAGNGGIESVVNGEGGAVHYPALENKPQTTKVGINSYIGESVPEDPSDTETQEQEPLGKRGIASYYYASSDPEKRDVSVLAGAGANWIYNWGYSSDTLEEAIDAQIDYVPMLWNGHAATDELLTELRQQALEGNIRHILTFNEPDLSGQANMTVDEAVASYEKICNVLKGTGVKIGSPAGAAAESAWLEEFVRKADAKGLPVDFIAIHVYQDPTHPESVSSLGQALDRLYNKYQRPIWITEIGSTDVSPIWNWPLYGTLDHDSSTAYMKELFEMLDENDKVERFAWFVDYSDNLQGTAYTRIFDISDDSFTPEGKVFAGVEDEPDAGDGSGTGEESGTGDGTGTGEESGAGDGSGTGGVTIGDDPTPGAGEVIDTPDPGQGEESGTPNDGKQDKPKPPHNGNKIAKSVKQVVITVAIVVKTVCKAILKIFGR